MSDNETDTESYYSNDSDDEYYENEYEPEEPSLTKYNIILCRQVYNQHLVFVRFKRLNYNEIRSIYNEAFTEMYRKLEIAECIYLPTQECVGIIKTIWIKLIQRTWKNIFKERKRVIKERCKLSSLKYREINGKWPNTCSYYPHYKGSLNYLSRSAST